MKKHTGIARLIARKTLGDKLTPDEEATLKHWLTDKRHAATYDDVRRLDMAADILRLRDEDYGEKMAARFHREQRQKRRHIVWRQMALWTGAAAVAALLFIAVPHLVPPGYDNVAHMQPAETSIVPGGAKAVLTLADGRQIGVTDDADGELDRLMDSVRAADADTLQQTAVRYHTLSVPRGGEFRHELADGTRVWLNSESELRFPETFAGAERHVYVKGEAFFDVAHDEAHPFVASTERGDIRVLGTRFNLTDYAGQPLAATLVEGSISFRTPQGRNYAVAPSQQLTFDDASGQVDVRTVDVSVYTAWVDRQFVFYRQPLENIMNVLARWYDFHPVFADDSLRGVRLSGRLLRDEDVRVLLHSYERAMGIRFVIRGNNIIVTQTP